MFCPQCGKQITDDAAFCPQCGAATGGAPTEATSAQVAAQAPVATPASTPQPQVAVGYAANGATAPKKKRSKKPLAIGIAAVVIVAAIGVGVAFATGAFNNLFTKTLEGTWDISLDYTDSTGLTSSYGNATLTVNDGSWTLECIEAHVVPYAQFVHDTSKGYTVFLGQDIDGRLEFGAFNFGSNGIGYTLSGTYTQNDSGSTYEYDVDIASYEISESDVLQGLKEELENAGYTVDMANEYATEHAAEYAEAVAATEQGLVDYAADYDLKVSVPKDGVGSDFPVGSGWNLSGSYDEKGYLADVSVDVDSGGSFSAIAWGTTVNALRGAGTGTWELVGDAATFTVQPNSDSPEKVVVTVRRV